MLLRKREAVDRKVLHSRLVREMDIENIHIFTGNRERICALEVIRSVIKLNGYKDGLCSSPIESDRVIASTCERNQICVNCTKRIILTIISD